MASDPSNLEIAAVFDELADLYELDGAIVHRVMAYRSAAKAAREAMVSVAGMTRQGRVTELPGIGKTLEEKLVALLQTGTIPALEKLRAKYPAGLLEMTRLPGLGPKRARRLFGELGIDSPEMLRAAAEQHRLRDVKGFGPKFEESVLSSLAAGVAERPAQRVLLHRALTAGERLVAALREHPAAERVELAGSARRQTDSVKDLDIIATASDPGALVRALADLDEIESASAPNEHAARGRTHTGLSVDLRVVSPANFGNLMQHFTGSQAHNVALREAAVRRGLHVSEYGILDDATGETMHCATEEEVYERLGLAYPEPELRENRGELAAGFVPPRLITVEDLRGDLHMHTTASDGRATIEDMARMALARGYEYIAITDHSATHGFGNHVTPDELERQIERVAEVNELLAGEGITVLAGTETNILPSGSPDYDDDLLARLDWVVGSIHTAFGTPTREMTKRMVAAIEHPYVDVIGHPTGRKIGRRQGYGIDLDEVIAAAARTHTMLEINSAPDRRDLDDVNARAAAQAGVLLTIDSDAHGPETMQHVRWGVATARRAWLTPENVANTRPWPEFAALRKRVRAGR